MKTGLFPVLRFDDDKGPESPSNANGSEEQSQATVDNNKGLESPSNTNGSKEDDDAMQVDDRSLAPVPPSNNQPFKWPCQNSIQVNDCTSMSAPLPNSPPQKRTCQNTKRNYQEADDEESSDESDEEMAPPPKSNKTNRQKSWAIIPSAWPIHDLRLDIHKHGPEPVIVGSKYMYMKVEVIDLTEIEVIYAMSPLFFKSYSNLWIEWKSFDI